MFEPATGDLAAHLDRYVLEAYERTQRVFGSDLSIGQYAPLVAVQIQAAALMHVGESIAMGIDVAASDLAVAMESILPAIANAIS